MYMLEQESAMAMLAIAGKCHAAQRARHDGAHARHHLLRRADRRLGWSRPHAETAVFAPSWRRRAPSWRRLGAVLAAPQHATGMLGLEASSSGQLSRARECYREQRPHRPPPRRAAVPSSATCEAAPGSFHVKPPTLSRLLRSRRHPGFTQRFYYILAAGCIPVRGERLGDGAGVQRDEGRLLVEVRVASWAERLLANPTPDP